MLIVLNEKFYFNYIIVSNHKRSNNDTFIIFTFMVNYLLFVLACHYIEVWV